MDFKDIPQLPRAHYEIDVPWEHVERTLKDWGSREGDMGGINLDPDYQRSHVWTADQQVAYVEYILQGGEVGRNITWNSPDWGRGYKAPTELVDGKQRLEAVRAFLRGDLRAFGHLYSEFTGRMRIFQDGFRFRVCTLKTRAEVLQLYLNINAGGTPHTAAEIKKVRDLLKKA